jgi:hypothetical protein
MRTFWDAAVKKSDVRSRFKRLIGACSGLGLLLTRYHIIDNAYFGVYLHHLNQSDEERAQHDHPWSFFSIILTRGYTEVTPKTNTGHNIFGEKRKFYPRFSVLFRPAEHIHRLEMEGPVWTLVLRGPERRVWGFWPMNPLVGVRQWMHHIEYGEKFCE